MSDVKAISYLRLLKWGALGLLVVLLLTLGLALILEKTLFCSELECIAVR